MLDDYVAYANKMWENWIKEWCYDNTHVFLRDLTRVTHASPDISKKDANKKPIKRVLSEYVTMGSCKTKPSDVLPERYVRKMLSIIKAKQVDYSKMTGLAEEMSKYYLEPTATLDITFPIDDINILILGGGPTGLIMANYLAKLQYPRLNVLMIDNRVYGEYRMPYTRDQPYDSHYEAFTDFWPQASSLTDDRFTMQIKHLEYVLYALVRATRTHIVYTKAIDSQATLEKLVAEKHISVVYDCTGGRLDLNYLKNSSDIFSNYQMTMPKWSVIKDANTYRIKWKSMDGRFFLRADYYENGQFVEHLWQEYPSAKHIRTLHDLNLLKPLHGKCVNIKNNAEFSKLISTIVDPELRRAILDGLVKAHDTIFFYIVEPKMHHMIRIASTFHVGKQKCAYVALGDTAFSSHFYIGAGLSRLSSVNEHLAWYLQSLYVK